MTKDIELICTDRGGHRPTPIDVLRVSDDGTFDVLRTRTATAPWADVPGAQLVAGDESTAAPTKILAIRGDHRADYGGRRRWCFPCPRCRRDKLINEATMRDISVSGESTCDLSTLA